ncbi:MFS transporter [Falsarthrobacter nasiphocae]|uniref:MFS transporter n=1 Tax=Falsarthrobacter nasiphocae TaxID=189863 RepID=A0AAE4C5P3_9MICC|nr:MFS transporter [Falsarthrobacter nasiphocae]MDR6891698.1 putative MFS transporter [Falsarthrobacter nasiphocae]
MTAPAPTGQLPTAAEIVQDLPFRWGVQGRIFLIGGLGFMFDAWDVTLNGVLAPLLVKHWHLSAGETALLGTSNLIGMGVGAFAWGAVADRLGRKTAFSLTLAMFGVFTVLGGLAPNYEIFLVMRFLAGMGLGGCVPVDYALVGEFTPARVRGRILTAMDGWWPVGAALCAATSAWILSVVHDWRLLMAVMVLPVALVFWVRLSVPESPLFLARRGREAEARAVVDHLVRATGAEPRDYIMGSEPARESSPSMLGAVWRFSARRTAVAWALFMTILLAYYICLLWMPKILVGAGFVEAKAFLTTAGMALVGVLGVIVAALLVERVGRRILLAISAPAALLCLIAASMRLHDAAWVTAWLLGYGFLIQVAIPVLYAYVSELYPTRLRASGFGWASAASRVAAGLGPLAVVGVLWPTIGITGSFWVLLGLIVAALGLMWVWAPETRGLELE